MKKNNGKQVKSFRLADYHEVNFGGNISVVKVKDNHYAVLILNDNSNHMQHVYIYRATESVDEFGDYHYSWNYAEPICVSFKMEDYVHMPEVNPTDEEACRFTNEVNDWHDGKHIQKWIVKNLA